MYEYIKGKITMINPNSIVLDNNGIGYLIYTSNSYSFNINEDYTVYLYQSVREDDISLYGFKTKEEKEMFLKLINVKGLGCKMALPLLAPGGVENIVKAIDEENVTYLKKFPKIGDKVAKQIILDLKGKLAQVEDSKNIKNEELIETLKSLGYKQTDINKVLDKITSQKIEDQIKEALKLMLK